MANDKGIKKEFKAIASKDPDKYYATSVLKQEGFKRKQRKCGTYFWTVTNSDVCGDPSCSGGFRFFGERVAKKELDYIQVWTEFSKHFKNLGYTPIKRYPVVARWRQDTDFVQASIYDFQPYVVSGEVDPPANPLVVPQMCLRFNDIDNIGITGAHYCAFVMIGQHAFMKPKDWNQAKYFSDIHSWLNKGLGLPNEEITFHEDAWAGGGNFGPCMEYFSRGLELGNQVYMMYEQTPSGNKELNLKVLDMGMDHERNAWFTKGSSTSYETTFPTVVKKLYGICGIETDQDLMGKFLPYSSYLNVDEVEDINKTWDFVAKKTGYETNYLRSKVMDLAALYSVAEHSRALLVALSDGALPSNVGGGYNLRAILRRALYFIDKNKWNVDMADLCKRHAEYLKPLFPELLDNLNEVTKILEVEKQKYDATKGNVKKLITRTIGGFVLGESKLGVNTLGTPKTEVIPLDTKKLLELYDSHGIAPELIKEEAKKLGKNIEIPDNFYSMVADLHEKQSQEHATKKEEKLDLEGVPDTSTLYFEDYKKNEFDGRVIKIIDTKVILDTTYFYPTSGGQLHDLGFLNGIEVTDVFKQGKVVVHVLKEIPNFREGELVHGKINLERRMQLAKHHTSTHIVNAAAKKILGNHVNQAGAKKDIDKATIDITHYQSITDEELKKIEEEANHLVKKHIKVLSSFVPRTEAEQKYGMNIYQGGAVPGKLLRIVNIENVDVEACGGTHLHNTSEAGHIKILKSSKISDGIVRLYFTAGDAAFKEGNKEQSILDEASKLLGVEADEIPARVSELFEKWKIAKKAVEKQKNVSLSELELVKKENFNGNILEETAKILKTQQEHIPKTIKRFLSELEEAKKKLN